MLDISGLRAAMRADLDGKRSKGSSEGEDPEQPSSFNILQDSLRRRVNEIHTATRMNLPCMDGAGGKSDFSAQAVRSLGGGRGLITRNASHCRWGSRLPEEGQQHQGSGGR